MQNPPGAKASGRAAEPLRVGLIAPELGPFVGGMPEFERQLVAALASRERLSVFSTAEFFDRSAPAIGEGIEHHPVLTWKLSSDLRQLEAAEVDVWLGLNAALSPLAPRLEQPFFAYFHGNDFLHPWIPYGEGWLARVRRPYAMKVRRFLRRAAIARSQRHLRHLFTNSRSTARIIGDRFGIAEERISVCPPGVADSFFQDRRAPPSDTLRLLTVCRLTRGNARKNVDGVLRAIALLAKRVPLRYTVVGDGDDLPRLRRLAEELGIVDKVRFLGRVDRDRLLDCYAESDLFILAARASRVDVEGFGIVYLEASAAGVPVICSRAGGATDALEDGVNGLLIPSSSPPDIAAGIERFSAERERFPPARVRGFAERFRWPLAADRIRREIACRI